MEPNPRSILQAFGGSTDKVESLYRWAPVYRVGPGGAWVLKRTRSPIAAGRAIADWTRALKAAGIRSVAPIADLPENPMAIGDESWVLYPFVSGSPYEGRVDQLRAAGRLLGSIHALAANGVKGPVATDLKHHPTVPILDSEDLESGLEQLNKAVAKHAPDLAEETRSISQIEGRRFALQTAPALRDEMLPTAICTWDYKASNVVFSAEASANDLEAETSDLKTETGTEAESETETNHLKTEADTESETVATLIDPDNASSIPRLFDLAISVVLFNNFESEAAPRRVFSPDEWCVYRGAYLEAISLNDLEHEVWDHVLHAAWMDEGLYVLYADPEEWANPDVRPFFESLLRFDIAEFPLR